MSDEQNICVEYPHCSGEIFHEDLCNRHTCCQQTKKLYIVFSSCKEVTLLSVIIKDNCDKMRLGT